MPTAGGSQKKKAKENWVKEKWETGMLQKRKQRQAQECGREEKGKEGEREHIYSILLIYMKLEVYS